MNRLRSEDSGGRRLVPLLALLGILAFLVALVIRLPAAQAWAWFGDAAPVEAAGISGTVWNGRATSVHYQDEVFHDVRWQLLPRQLVAARAAARLQLLAEDGRVQGLVSRGLRGDVQASDLRLVLPASQILRLSGRADLPVDIDGQVDAFVETLHLSADGELLLLRGLVSWLDGSFSLGDRIALGSYALRVDGDGQRLQGRLQDTDAALRLEGDLELDLRNGGVRGEIIMQAREQADPALIENLRFAGLPDPSAANRVRFRGNLNDPFGFRGDLL